MNHKTHQDDPQKAPEIKPEVYTECPAKMAPDANSSPDMAVSCKLLNGMLGLPVCAIAVGVINKIMARVTIIIIHNPEDFDLRKATRLLNRRLGDHRDYIEDSRISLIGMSLP